NSCSGGDGHARSARDGDLPQGLSRIVSESAVEKRSCQLSVISFQSSVFTLHSKKANSSTAHLRLSTFNFRLSTSRLRTERSSLRRVYINPRDALADRAEDFVGHGAELLGDLERGDRARLRLADQDDLIAHGDAGDIGNVEQRQVHADVADDPRVLVVDDGAAPVRKRSAQAIRVAHRHRRDPRRSAGVKGGAVAERRAARHILEVHYARLESEYRLEDGERL